MFFCSGPTIGCKRVAQLDPRFVVLSKYRPGMIFCGGPLKSVVQDLNLAIAEDPQKKFNKELCIIPYDINMV